MFYSQIILAKKGPLGKVWLAAHWGDKKLGRPQIFATDISASVDSIVHPQVPLALRVSGHLLLGVVRIYSRQVKYLMNDAQEAMLKIKLAFLPAAAGMGAGDPTAGIDLQAKQSDHQLNIANFGEYQDLVFEPVQIWPDGTATTAAGTGFQLPFDLHDETNAEDWEPAEFDEHEDFLLVQDERDREGDEENGAPPESLGRARMMRLPTPATGTPADYSIFTDYSAMSQPPQHLTQPNEEEWTAFDPDDDGPPPAPMDTDDDDEKEEAPPLVAGSAANESHVSDIEITRAAATGVNDSLASDMLSRGGGAASISRDKAPGEPITPGDERSARSDFPPANDDDIMMPLDDDDTQDAAAAAAAPALPPNPMEDPASLSLSVSQEGGDGERSGALSVGGLDESADAGSATGGTQHRKPTISSTRKRSLSQAKRPKKRKIHIDDAETELSDDFIKAMLKDTEDIVSQSVFDPAHIPDVDDEGDEDAVASKTTKVFVSSDKNKRSLDSFLSVDRQLTRPALGATGQLAPRLLRRWALNTAPVVGKPFPYALLNEAPPVAEAPRDGTEEEASQSDAESSERATRHQQKSSEKEDEDEEDMPPPLNDDDEFAPAPPEDDHNVPLPDGDDEMQPMVDETPNELDNSKSIGTYSCQLRIDNAVFVLMLTFCELLL